MHVSQKCSQGIPNSLFPRSFLRRRGPSPRSCPRQNIYFWKIRQWMEIFMTTNTDPKKSVSSAGLHWKWMQLGTWRKSTSGGSNKKLGLNKNTLTLLKSEILRIWDLILPPTPTPYRDCWGRLEVSVSSTSPLASEKYLVMTWAEWPRTLYPYKSFFQDDTKPHTA